MKKSFVTLTLLAALLLTVSGCGTAPAVENGTPADEPQITAALPAPAESAEPAPVEPTAETGRADGERFEATIFIEGMEEPVVYEHIVNTSAGFEMDYEVESLLRVTLTNGERFLSLWDDPENPENFFEVTRDTGNANLVADALSATLSNDYEVVSETLNLDGVGSCIRLDASEVKGGGWMPEQLQTVYIIPAGNGCLIATAHCSIEAAEGFGHRFACMMNTLRLLERGAEAPLSDEQALAAVKNYCLLNNPSLEEIINAGEYPVYWEITASEEQETVVLFRSYTGSETHYYIDRITGEARVTDFVPGITPEEVPSDETLNVRDYLD